MIDDCFRNFVAHATLASLGEIEILKMAAANMKNIMITITSLLLLVSFAFTISNFVSAAS